MKFLPLIVNDHNVMLKAIRDDELTGSRKRLMDQITTSPNFQASVDTLRVRYHSSMRADTPVQLETEL